MENNPAAKAGAGGAAGGGAGGANNSASASASNSSNGPGTGSGGGGATGGTAADTAAGIPFYEKQRAHLKELIARKRNLEKRLANTEDSIYAKETEYLENTPSGNIITGFDNYTKGTGGGAVAQRRKTGLTDANRVFSRSSVSYISNATDSQTPASTPASHAPTPLSTTFKDKDGGASSAPTPTSATAAGKAGKKNKRNSAVAAASAGAEDSETDSRETKKVRTNFGAPRK